MSFRHAIALALIAAPVAVYAQAPEWRVVQAQSRLGFAASMNGDGFTGNFARWTARIRFDPKALSASRVVVVIDMRSARTGDATRDESLPGDDWFGAAAFPTAIFTATRFRDLGGNRYVASGTLKIRDATRPIDLPFTLAINGTTATMRGSVTIDRRSFGVGQGQFAGVEAVPAAVRVDVALVARR